MPCGLTCSASTSCAQQSKIIYARHMANIPFCVCKGSCSPSTITSRGDRVIVALMEWAQYKKKSTSYMSPVSSATMCHDDSLSNTLKTKQSCHFKRNLWVDRTIGGQSAVRDDRKYRLVQKKGTVLLSTSLAWPAVAGCSRAETFSQLSSFSFAQPCIRIRPLSYLCSNGEGNTSITVV